MRPTLESNVEEAIKNDDLHFALRLVVTDLKEHITRMTGYTVAMSTGQPALQQDLQYLENQLQSLNQTANILRDHLLPHLRKL